MSSSIHDNREFEDGQSVRIASRRSDIGGQDGQVVKLYAEHAGNLFYLVALEGSEHVVCESDLRDADKVTNLELIANGEAEDWRALTNDELLALGIGYGIPGPLSDEQVRREAAEILSELEA